MYITHAIILLLLTHTDFMHNNTKRTCGDYTVLTACMSIPPKTSEGEDATVKPLLESTVIEKVALT